MQKVEHFPIKIIHSNGIDGSVTNVSDYLALLERFKLISPHKIIEMNQVHGDNIIIVDEDIPNQSKIEKCDAVITSVKDNALMIKTADCIPLILYDSQNKIVAAVHAGWRGLVDNIHQKTVNKMTKTFKTEPHFIHAYVGPSIRSCCYIFEDMPKQANQPKWEQFIKLKNNKWHIDLVGFLIQDLLKSGINLEKIIDSNQCTYHHKNLWFSYFRHKQKKDRYGTFATVVQLNS